MGCILCISMEKSYKTLGVFCRADVMNRKRDGEDCFCLLSHTQWWQQCHVSCMHTQHTTYTLNFLKKALELWRQSTITYKLWLHLSMYKAWLQFLPMAIPNYTWYWYRHAWFMCAFHKYFQTHNKSIWPTKMVLSLQSGLLMPAS